MAATNYYTINICMYNNNHYRTTICIIVATNLSIIDKIYHDRNNNNNDDDDNTKRRLEIGTIFLLHFLSLYCCSLSSFSPPNATVKPVTVCWSFVVSSWAIIAPAIARAANSGPFRRVILGAMPPAMNRRWGRSLNSRHSDDCNEAVVIPTSLQ